MKKSAKKSAKRVPRKPAFHWFQGKSVRDLVDHLTAAGPDTARLEVRVEGKEMTFTVVKVAGEGEMATLDEPIQINASHICPFDCP